MSSAFCHPQEGREGPRGPSRPPGPTVVTFWSQHKPVVIAGNRTVYLFPPQRAYHSHDRINSHVPWELISQKRNHRRMVTHWDSVSECHDFMAFSDRSPLPLHVKLYVWSPLPSGFWYLYVMCNLFLRCRKFSCEPLSFAHLSPCRISPQRFCLQPREEAPR